MEKTFNDYLSLLGDLTNLLEALTTVEQEKLESVRSDDLEALNNCMKQEQALSLSIRGFEQRQQKALGDLGLEGVPLRDLPEHAPKALLPEARKVAEALQLQYELFRAAFDSARDVLECNLHQVEKALAQMEQEKQVGVGYETPSPELPKKMKTDFRA